MYRSDLYRRQLSDVQVTEFFGSVSLVQETGAAYPLKGGSSSSMSAGPTPATEASQGDREGGGRASGAAIEAAQGLVAGRAAAPEGGSMLLMAPPAASLDWATLGSLAGLLLAVAAASLLGKQ